MRRSSFLAALVALTALGPVAALDLAAQQPPAPPPPTLTRIAFGSCFDEELPQPIWPAILAYRPDVFVFAGDNVYGSVPRDQLTADLPTLRKAYEDALRVDGFNAIREQTRTLAIWDDHDFGLNDGGTDHPFKVQAKDLFLDFWEIPRDDPRRRNEGLYHAQTFGPEGRRIQVILLDTRWFRSPLRRAPDGTPTPFGAYVPNDDPQATMLGETQWAWLADRLREPAELRLVVSSIQVLAEGHGFERWGNLPRERQRLYDLVRDTGAAGVVFLSGDRHIAGLYRETAGTPYPFVEITSSSINRPFPGNREPGPNRLGGVWGNENFGTVDVDWWERTVTLSVRGMNGAAVRTVAVKLDELKR